MDYLRSLVAPVTPCLDGEQAKATTALTIGSAVACHPLPSPARMVSWNIHRGYDAAGVLAGLRVAMEHLDPDVLLLQEVPVAATGPWWSEPGVQELLVEHLVVFAPMHRVSRPTAYYPFQQTGVVVAIRGGFDDPVGIVLPVVSRPKLGPGHFVERVAVGVRCHIEDTPVKIWNVHLENTARPSGRAHQARAVATAVGGGPAIVCGDFNTMLPPFEGVERVLADAGFRKVTLADGWSLMPQLDHFFVRGVRVRRAERLPVRGSDHRPIYGEFEIVR